MQEQVDDLREINPELRIKGLVTMRQKNKTSLDFEEWMKTSSGFDMFVTPIRRSIVAEKASMRTASCHRTIAMWFMSYSRKWRGERGKEKNHMQQQLMQTSH